MKTSLVLAVVLALSCADASAGRSPRGENDADYAILWGRNSTPAQREAASKRIEWRARQRIAEREAALADREDARRMDYERRVEELERQEFARQVERNSRSWNPPSR